MSQSFGRVFFPALCLGTGGLGCWQSVRYFEKEDFIAQQAEILRKDEGSPIESLAQIEEAGAGDTNELSRRLNLRGRFLHSEECIVGPRGPPPGALAKDGPNSGRGGGGLASSPQGFYVFTPFLLLGGGVVLVNRGWDSNGHTDSDYVRPSGVQELSVLTSAVEKGGMFSPPPLSPFIKKNGRSQPNLLWLEEQTLRDMTKIQEAKLHMFKEVVAQSLGSLSFMGLSSSPRSLVRPTIDQAVEFKVTPETHAGYAATWFSLSVAGVFMTRKLLRNIK